MAADARYREVKDRGFELRNDTRGAVFVEFLIAFLPVYTFFLCLIQLGLLFAVRLISEHAAINAARAAAVVIGDEPRRYRGEPLHRVSPGGERYKAIRNAALLTLSPLILNGVVQKVELTLSSEDAPGGQARGGPIAFPPMRDAQIAKVRVRLEVSAACRIGLANRIACPPSASEPMSLLVPIKKVRAEAIYPYQGAAYEYR